MEPWQSWAIVGAVGAGAFYYYSQSGRSKRGRARIPLAPAEQMKRRGSDSVNEIKDRRKKKEKTSDGSDRPASDAGETPAPSVRTSSADRLKKRKGGKQQHSKLAQSSAVEVSDEVVISPEDGIEEDDGMDNAEFAKQLSGLKTGTSLKKGATVNETGKTKKQSKRNGSKEISNNRSMTKVNGVSSTQDLSTASSTTGADADDDLSPAVSPEFGATQSVAPSGTDVSDMLEPPSKGPSVLRLTEAKNPQSSRQPKQPRAAQEPETKKQRQNRQKNELKKAMREEAEKERRVLMEKQLRTAREAEGRPAKNGLSTSKPPSTNAWATPASEKSSVSAPAIKSSNLPLLDTFDETTPTASSHTGGLNRDLPSEEEQMRLISEMDSDNTWSTVAKGGKNKKKSSAVTASSGDKTATMDNERTDAPSGTEAAKEDKDGRAKAANTKGDTAKVTDTTNSDSKEEPKRVKATKETIDHNVWTRDNIHQHPDYDPDFPYALTGHPDDDDWAVV